MRIDIIYRYEPQEMSARPPPSDSEAALLRLDEGNRAFAALFEAPKDRSVGDQWIIPVDPCELGLSLGELKRPKQHPFAAVLGCSDARVPVELIFNEGPNDLFVIRVAGNVLGTEVLGSLKYAVDHLSDSLRLLVVLGHSGCGAVTAAVDSFLNPAGYLPLVAKHSLRTILDHLLVVVQASSKKLQSAFGPEIARHPGYREALIEASIVTNAALAAHAIQRELAETDRAGLQAAYGVYLLETRHVWAPRVGEIEGTSLAAAPRDAADFAELGNAIVQSDRIASLLRPRPHSCHPHLDV
jgi:carbonic anhydrase